MSGEQTALAVQPRVMVEIGPRGLALVDLDGAWRVAEMMVRSGMCPKGYDRAEQVLGALTLGAEVGMTPWAAIRSIATINGRPAIWGDMTMALVRASGLLGAYADGIEGEAGTADFVVWVEMSRRGDATLVRRTFGVRDAERAGLWGKAGPWTQYPQRMLFHRARSWVLRDLFGDVLLGIPSVEELDEDSTVSSAPLRERMRVTTEVSRPSAQPAAEPMKGEQIEVTVIDDLGPEPSIEPTARKMTVHEGIEHLGKMGIGRGVSVTEIPALLAQIGVELPEGGAGLAITASMRDWRAQGVPWLHKTGEARGTKYWFGAPPEQAAPAAADATPDPFALD